MSKPVNFIVVALLALTTTGASANTKSAIDPATEACVIAMNREVYRFDIAANNEAQVKKLENTVRIYTLGQTLSEPFSKRLHDRKRELTRSEHELTKNLSELSEAIKTRERICSGVI